MSGIIERQQFSKLTAIETAVIGFVCPVNGFMKSVHFLLLKVGLYSVVRLDDIVNNFG